MGSCCERLSSPRQLCSLVLIRENDLSTDAVPIGGDKQHQPSLCRLVAVLLQCHWWLILVAVFAQAHPHPTYSV